MRRLLAAAALFPLAALAAQDYYGAIAYSPSRQAQGWAFNHPTRRDAEKTAVANCRRYATDCKLQVWFKNACGSLATGPGGFGTAWGSSQAGADEEALKLCHKHSRECAVVRRVCTEGRK